MSVADPRAFAQATSRGFPGSDADFDPYFGEEPVELDLSTENVVVVDGLPRVPQEKLLKLTAVLTKVCNQVGTVVENGVFMPMNDEAGLSEGFAFVEFETAEGAEKCIQEVNGARLDRNHSFIVSAYDELERLEKVPDEFDESSIPEYKETENLKQWLLDARARDQFVLRFQDDTEIFWNDGTGKPSKDYARKMWTESYVMWSPKGTYLTTFHRQGVVVWGGPNWTKIMRFSHPEVKLCEFSPCERYMVTWNGMEKDNPKDPQGVIIWDVKTGEKKRGFLSPRERDFHWPLFKWSHDDRYFARMGRDCISLYETPSMELVKKRSIPCEGIVDFLWSPSSHLISWWKPEQNNIPARVCLLDVNTRQIVRQKNLFNVAECNMHWSPTGQYLGIKVDRIVAKSADPSTFFELLRVSEKGIPVESLEINEPIVAFAWEPEGHRCAIIHGESSRPSVSFYSLAGKKLQLLKTLEKQAANHLFWSPRGGNIVLAGIKGMNGALKFINVNEIEEPHEGVMNEDEHFMCTDVEWDPSGRYVCSYVSHWRYQMENGLVLWDFRGKPLFRQMKDRFYQFLWRPRPPTLLSKEKAKSIRKNIKEYSARYNKEDEERKKHMQSEANSERRKLYREFMEYLDEKKHQYNLEKSMRVTLRDGVDSDDEGDYDVIEVAEEELLSVNEEVLTADEA